MAPTVPRPDVPNEHIYMVRDTNAPVPQLALPAAYRFRTYREGDEQTWLALQRRTEPFVKIADDLFRRQFSRAPEALPERMFFIDTAAGETIGTITAWWEPQWYDGREWGKIHWVAVVPEHQGKGLSKPMMTHAMNFILARHARCHLGSSTGRVYALKVYLDYGFTPWGEELRKPEVLAGWRAVQRVLNHPLLNSLPG